MNYITDLCRIIIHEKCCDIFLKQHMFRDYECLSLTISRLISIGVISFSSIIKIPQIIQILYHKSGFGLSTTSLYLEITVNVLCICFHYQRHFPFSTYGEAFFILTQNVIISFLVTHFDMQYPFLFWDLVMIIEFSFLFSVFKSIASLSLISFLWGLNIPLSLSYKIVQIYDIKKKKCKGELSTISTFLKAIGSLGRVFTTFREINRFSVFILYFLNFTLNALIFLQCLKYPKKNDSMLELKLFKTWPSYDIKSSSFNMIPY